MLGRDLITYILQNGYSDKEIFDDKHIVGFISEEEAAKKFGVGKTTIRVWVNQGRLKGIRINDIIFIPFNSEDPRIGNDVSTVLSSLEKEK